MKSNFIKRIVTSIIFIPIILIMIIKGGYLFNFLLFILFLSSVYEVKNLKNFTVKYTIYLIIIIFIFCAYEIRNYNEGKKYFLFILFITWLSDTGGYLFGKFFGGKKIKIISPNKTYIGFFGALILPLFILFFSNYYTNYVSNSIFYDSLFILISSLFVVIGDLVFSMFKRKCSIKDYSNIIPGHGGVLDRVDGMIFLTIFNYFYFKFI